jgi:hypothetical protein
MYFNDIRFLILFCYTLKNYSKPTIFMLMSMIEQIDSNLSQVFLYQDEEEMEHIN